MAILSAAELKASPEAIKAKVNAFADPVVEGAIRDAEAALNLALGYKVANSETSLVVNSADTDSLYLPERVRAITAISDAFPGGGAVEVTSWGIRNNGFSLYRSAGWRANNVVTITGSFGYAGDDDKYVLAKRFVLLAAVRQLAASSTSSGMPTPSGAYLTGYQSEGASFTFFTPSGDTTGFADLDALIAQIGRHPRKSGGLYTIAVGPAAHDLGPEAVWLGVEEPTY